MPERQRLGFLEIFAVTLGTIFTTGVFIVPATVGAMLGYSSIWLWVALALLSIPMGLSFASLASMFSRSGGPVIFVRAAFGDFPAFITGWSTWLYSTTAIAALAVITAQFVGALIPLPDSGQGLLAVLLLMIFTAINWFGIRSSAHVEMALIVLSIGLMAAYIVLGLPSADFSRFTLALPDISVLGFAAVLGFELFIGWETATIIAEEVENPKKILPRALLLTVIVMAALYVGVISVFMGNANIAAAAEAANPLAAAAGNFAGGLTTVFSLVAVLVGLSALNSWTTTVARLPYVMARQKLFLRQFEKLNRHGAPSRALLLQLGLAVAVALTGSFELAVTLLLSVGLVMYIIVFLALLRLKGIVPAEFPVPSAFPIVGIIALVFMLLALPPHILFTGWLLIAAGLPAFIAVKLITDRAFIERWWDRTSWLWAWYWPSLLYDKKTLRRVLSAAKLKRNMTVLDYGCGTGVTTLELSKLLARGRVVAADVSRAQLSRALFSARGLKRPNIIWVKMTRLVPFPKESFDRIVSTVAINYFTDPEHELRNLLRALKKRGRAVFLAVRAPLLLTQPFLAKDIEIRAVFSRAGWKNIAVKRERKLLREWILIEARKK